MEECSARIYRFHRTEQDICLTVCVLSGLVDDKEATAKHLWPSADNCWGMSGFIAESACHFAEASRLIDENENHKANRFLKVSDRQRYVMAHGILRMVLASQLGARPESLSFRIAEFGKPFLVRPYDYLKFNLSHSGRHIAIVTAAREVGVDIEEIAADFDYVQIARRFFVEEEQNYVLACDDEECRRVRFNTLWVRKEALLKAAGIGLSRLSNAATLEDRVELSLQNGEPERYLLTTICSRHDLALALAVRE